MGLSPDPESPECPSEYPVSGSTRFCQVEDTQRKIPSSSHPNERSLLASRVTRRFPGRNGRRKASASVPCLGPDSGVCVCDRSWEETTDPDSPGLNA